MRLYLSSYGLGNARQQLVALMGGAGRVAIIENALDLYSCEQRLKHRSQIYDPYEEFANLGAEAIEFDLRLYQEQCDKLYAALVTFNLIWVLG